MSFTPEDLGFSRAYTFDMAAPISSTTSSGTATPAEPADAFPLSTSSTSTTSNLSTDSVPSSLTEPAPSSGFALARRSTELGNASNPLPHHQRAFPKPPSHVDVKAALEGKPQPWSIQGQREANRRREEQVAARMATGEAQAREAEKRRLELAKAKREMLALKEELTLMRPRGAF